MITASIIISSYNYAQYLRQAIDSALEQSYRQTEVIVVDDGSADDSPQIIRSYEGRVNSLLQVNAGQASALNAGFSAASGDVVVFLDSDDALEPDAIERAVELMKGAIAKVHWPLREIDAAGVRGNRLVPVADLPQGDLRDVVLAHGPRSDAYLWPPTSGNAFSKDVLNRVMPIPEAAYRTCPDLYLCALAPLYGAIASCPDSLGLWRVHGQNNTWKQPFIPRVEKYAALWQASCDDLERHASGLGLKPQPARWRSESWWHRLLEAARQLCRIIPPESSFILLDDDQWACTELDGRPALPLMAREGQSWGAPADDAAAIEALEQNRRRGARFVVVPWHARWWLEHYAGLARHLRDRYACAAQSELLSVYDITGEPDAR